MTNCRTEPVRSRETHSSNYEPNSWSLISSPHAGEPGIWRVSNIYGVLVVVCHDMMWFIYGLQSYFQHGPKMFEPFVRLSFILNVNKSNLKAQLLILKGNYILNTAAVTCTDSNSTEGVFGVVPKHQLRASWPSAVNNLSWVWHWPMGGLNVWTRCVEFKDVWAEIIILWTNPLINPCTAPLNITVTPYLADPGLTCSRLCSL